MPSTREAVPVKYVSMTRRESPTASKIWAPWYERITEMPMRLKVFRRPFLTAVM